MSHNYTMEVRENNVSHCFDDVTKETNRKTLHLSQWHHLLHWIYEFIKLHNHKKTETAMFYSNISKNRIQ